MGFLGLGNTAPSPILLSTFFSTHNFANMPGLRGYVTPRRLSYSPGLRGSASRRVTTVTTTVKKKKPLSRKKSAKARSKAVKRAFRQDVGESPKTPISCKRTGAFSQEHTSCDSKKLYTVPLIRITRQVTGDISDIRQRQRDEVFLSGIQIQLIINNELQELPLFVNVAVVKWNDQANSFLNTDKSTLTTRGDFFRSIGANVRSLDFSNNIDAMQRHYHCLNTDAMSVYMHKRMLLVPSSGATTLYHSNKGTSFRTMNMYIPIRRKVSFHNETAYYPADGNIHLLYWFTPIDETAAGASQSAVAAASFRVYNYFRESA